MLTVAPYSLTDPHGILISVIYVYSEREESPHARSNINYSLTFSSEEASCLFVFVSALSVLLTNAKSAGVCAIIAAKAVHS